MLPMIWSSGSTLMLMATSSLDTVAVVCWLAIGTNADGHSGTDTLSETIRNASTTSPSRMTSSG